jgi:acetyl esterase/lipase
VTVYQPLLNGQPLKDRPVVFFVHGGAWIDGYSGWYENIISSVLSAENGYVVVNVDYRLTSAQVFLADLNCLSRETCDPNQAVKAAWYPANLNDVADAFRWTSAHIATYGGDAENIFLFGHSAGGHLVSLLATHSDFSSLRPAMRGIISMSGAYQLDSLGPIFYSALDQTFLGGHSDNAPELAEASPSAHLSAGQSYPHFYLLHCEFDMPALPEQAIAFRAGLEALNAPVSWDFLAGYTHQSEMTALGSATEEVTRKIVTYIETHQLHLVHLPVVLNP